MIDIISSKLASSEILNEPDIVTEARYVSSLCTLKVLMVKGATKLYFKHYSFVVVSLFNTVLCESAFM